LTRGKTSDSHYHKNLVYARLKESILEKKGVNTMTNIKITNVRPSGHSKIKANFNVLFEDLGLTIKECRLILNRDGDYFIGMPSFKVGEQYVTHTEIKNEDVINEVIDIVVKAVLDMQRQTG
jgi:hypothetical protein